MTMQFGAQYYRPPFPKKTDWARDLRRMKELGFGTVKHWAVWNQIERAPGKYDFSELDELVEMSAAHGLTVVLNAIPEGAPYHTKDGEDHFYQTASGEVLRYSGPANIPTAGWPGLCPDSPDGERMICAFIEALAKHYANVPCVAAIDVWNEPHLEPMFDYSGQLLCYCEHSKARFVDWLKDRYGSIERLNEKWFRGYASWDQVEPPRRFGTAADMIDWRRFWLYNLQRWLRMRVAAARKGAPHRLIQTHTAFSGYMGANNAGGLGNELGDEFLLAREVDAFGLSSFPLWLMGDEHVNIHFLNAEIIAEASREKPFYQVELQGGAGKAGLLGGRAPTAVDIRQWNYSVIAAGGKGVLYWQYAPEPAGTESPGFGLINPDGSDTPRLIEAGACARAFQTDALDKSRRVLSTNGIYLSRNADLLCYALQDECAYCESFKGIWQLLLDADIPCRFMHGDYIEHAHAEGLTHLYLPMALCLDDDERRHILSFVKNGGTLIAEGGAGMYFENAELDRQSTFWRELLDMRGAFVDQDEMGAYYFGHGSVAGDCEPLAGGALCRRYGDGKVIWLPHFAGQAYWKNRDESTRDRLAPLFDEAGYAFVDEKKAPGLAVRFLENENGLIAVWLNRGPEPRPCAITICGKTYAEMIPPQSGALMPVNLVPARSATARDSASATRRTTP